MPCICMQFEHSRQCLKPSKTRPKHLGWSRPPRLLFLFSVSSQIRKTPPWPTYVAMKCGQPLHFWSRRWDFNICPTEGALLLCGLACKPHFPISWCQALSMLCCAVVQLSLRTSGRSTRSVSWATPDRTAAALTAQSQLHLPLSVPSPMRGGLRWGLWASS